eukprot:1752170-Prymnesium_polylepis.1
MNPIEQLALAAMQRASEADPPKAQDDSNEELSEQEKGLDVEARVALRKERNRQSAASSRKRAKLRTEELEEENHTLRAENEKLRRLLAGYQLGGLVDPDGDSAVADKTEAAPSSSASTVSVDSELSAATTSNTPLNTPPLGPT